MRQVLWIFLIVFLLSLAGCSSDDEQSGTDSNVNNNADETNATNNENSDDDTNENNTANNEKAGSDDNDNANNDSDSNDEQNTKVQDETPTYEMDDASTIVPKDDSDEEEDVVLITIDDAPDEHTVDMAHTLKDLDVNAIFFVNGHFLEDDEGKEDLEEIHDMGFLIGNHTYSHEYLPEISSDEQREEIIEVSDMIEDVIGERPEFFRAPNGANTDTSEEIAEEEDMLLMNWTYGYDFMEPYQDKDKLIEAMVSGEAPDVGEDQSLLRPGANLLMHDREWTNEALEDIIKGLRDKDYEMVDPALIDTEK